jgi:hypothetical protein
MRCPPVTAEVSVTERAPSAAGPAAPTVAAMLQLQRSAGNRAARTLVQRYVQGNFATNLSGQTEFEAQTVDQPNYTINAATGTLAASPTPPVRVSDDGQMALEDADLSGRQPKVLYTTQAIVNNSNADLLAVQSDFELYVDRANAIRVTVNGVNHDLSRVLPRKRQFAGAARAASEQGLTMDAPPDCIIMAQQVMKANDPHGDRHPHLQVANLPQRGYEETRVAQYMAEWVSSTQKRMAPWAWLKFWKWFSNARGDAKRAFRANVQMDAQTIDNMALAYHHIQLNAPALAKQVAQSLGVNKFAMPNVGEAYETYRVGVGQPALQAPVAGTAHWTRSNWGQHIGGVVAASGNDRVTLENYARKHEVDVLRTGPDYYFQMYGSRKRQTWHWAWTAGARAIGSAPVGQTQEEALTMVVRHA